MNVRVFCKSCSADFSSEISFDAEPRQPCPQCQSTERVYHLSLFDAIHFRSQLKGKARDDSNRRPFMTFTFGDNLWRKMNRWMHLDRIIDRRRNRYYEHIEDPKTGEVTRHV